jgi:serine/threonine protein phosphatase PrpC
MSEEGQKLSNRDYFGYVEMDDFACYVLADSLDEEPSVNSAKLVVESIIRDFTEAPSMRKGRWKRWMHRAHTELMKQRGGMHLKASAVIVVTDYRKIRYIYVGNSRYYLIRNARILERTTDQSLTQNLTEAGKIPLDQAAAHEERNNLYSFLGERGTPKIQLSRKRKLESGDVFLLLSRGVWEQCSDEELLEIINTAKEPAEVLHQTEDFILGRQESKEIDNYTMAVTFVQKVYQSPKKPWTVKKVLMILLPVLLLVGGISLGLYLRHRKIREKEEKLAECMESGEDYLRYDNYQRAAEEFGEAKTLAGSLRKNEESDQADQYKKLAEQIILSDEALVAKEYEKAQELYLKAREMAEEAGNVGKTYIEHQLNRTKDYIEVYDLIAMGEKKEEYGNLKGAIEAYKEAKTKAADLYYSEGKAEALEKQAAAEEVLEKAQLADESRQKEQEESAAAEAAKQQKEEESAKELENQQKANDQQNAIELENQGNELLAQGQYDHAITFYQAAQTIYIRLEMVSMAVNLNQKIEAARAGSAAKVSEEAAKKASEEAGRPTAAREEAAKQVTAKQVIEEARTVEPKEATQQLPINNTEASGAGVNEVPVKPTTGNMPH